MFLKEEMGVVLPAEESPRCEFSPLNRECIGQDCTVLRRSMIDVIVVGGGVTGLGVAWDLSLRGLRVVLLERASLASGTSGRFHGLVHSGARYVVSDPVAAAQCAHEGAVLARIASRLVHPTGRAVCPLRG